MIRNGRQFMWNTLPYRILCILLCFINIVDLCCANYGNLSLTHEDTSAGCPVSGSIVCERKSECFTIFVMKGRGVRVWMAGTLWGSLIRFLRSTYPLSRSLIRNELLHSLLCCGHAVHYYQMILFLIFSSNTSSTLAAMKECQHF